MRAARAVLRAARGVTWAVGRLCGARGRLLARVLLTPLRHRRVGLRGVGTGARGLGARACAAAHRVTGVRCRPVASGRVLGGQRRGLQQ